MPELQTAMQQQPEVIVPPDMEAIKSKTRSDLGLEIEGLENSSPLARLKNDPEVIAATRVHLERIMKVNLEEAAEVEETTSGFQSIGDKSISDSNRSNQLLDQSIRRLAAAGPEGESVADKLVELQLIVQEADPHKHSFEPGWFTRQLGRVLPKQLGRPLVKYFIQSQSTFQTIDAIVTSLKRGAAQLATDNKTMIAEQSKMRRITKCLLKASASLDLLKEAVTARVAQEQDEDRKHFYEAQVLFELTQKMQAIEQQLLVHQQGYLAMEIMITNNKELIKEAKSAETVTVGALRIAAMLAQGLGNQRATLKAIQCIKATTNELLVNNALQMRQQGTAIHKEIIDGSLSIDSLKTAYNEMKMTFEEIENFRRQALVPMDRNIQELKALSEAAEQSIVKIEQGRKIMSTVEFDDLGMKAV